MVSDCSTKARLAVRQSASKVWDLQGLILSVSSHKINLLRDVGLTTSTTFLVLGRSPKSLMTLSVLWWVLLIYSIRNVNSKGINTLNILFHKINIHCTLPYSNLHVSVTFSVSVITGH